MNFSPQGGQAVICRLTDGLHALLKLLYVIQRKLMLSPIGGCSAYDFACTKGKALAAVKNAGFSSLRKNKTRIGHNLRQRIELTYIH